MNYKSKIILALVVAIVSAVVVEKYFDRTIVYKCTNRKTDLPVFIKVITHGAIHLMSKKYSSVEANYHHQNGETYVYEGMDRNYFDENIFVQGDIIRTYDEKYEKDIHIHPTIHFDLLTSSYSIHAKYYGLNPSDAIELLFGAIDYSKYQKCPYSSCEQLIATGFCTKK